LYQLLLLLLILHTPIYGYLDPGTGSMLLYFLIGIIATIFFSIKEFFYKIKIFFLTIKGGKVNIEKDLDVVFYSEGGKYWNVFEPILKNINDKEIKCGYFSSDKTDKGLNYKKDNLITKYLGNEFVSMIALNNLKATIVVMTTPQLHVLGLKKSKNVKHYIHLIHAPTDALIYKPYAFDYFDSVMCSGSHQIKSIRALEKLRDLPPKNLLQTGLTYYDSMIENKQSIKNDDKVILIAPTWGNNGMIHKYGDKILVSLLKTNITIIFRPHPQLYIDMPKQMEELEKKLSKHKNIEIDKSPSGDKSMARADLLISDISGIIFDFVFIHQKKVIVLSSDTYIGGLEAEFVSHTVWEFDIFDKIARVVKSYEIDDISNIALQELETNNTKDIQKIRDESLFNFGKAGKVGSHQILELLANYKPKKELS